LTEKALTGLESLIIERKCVFVDFNHQIIYFPPISEPLKKPKTAQQACLAVHLELVIPSGLESTPTSCQVVF
jgi:hypothetical protein